MTNKSVLKASDSSEADMIQEQHLLYGKVTHRMNITWIVDAQMEGNIKDAISEAMDYLRGVSGNPDLSFRNGDASALCVTLTCYLLENKRAEFITEYSGELTMLRLREGFGCGKTGKSEV